MQRTSKSWLVRTRTGEILGPFTQRELLEELQKQAFSHDDEIAPSHGYWLSAQTLSHHEAEEFTLTHAREQTMTKSLHQVSSPEAIAPGLSTSGLGEQEPPPTPRTARSALNEARKESALPPLAPPETPHLGLFAAGTLAIAVLLFALFRFSGKSPSGASGNFPGMSSTEGDSPFVKQIYGLIHSGATQVALKRLAQYNEKHPAKDDLEYLVPYAALLIIEGDSPARARKLLEQVLSNSPSPRLRSRAHHWLGYLLLSQDEGDMGESHFLEALQLNPKDAAARFNLGRAYLKQEKFSQAVDYLQLAELEAPELWLIHIYKGRAKAALGNMEEARASFKKAVETSPDRWITYIYYSLFLRGMQDLGGAQEVLHKMLTRDPRYETHSPPPWGFYQEKVNYAEYLTAFSTVMDKAPAEEREMGKLYLGYLLNGANGAEGKRIEAAAGSGGLTAKVLALEVALDRNASPEDLRIAINRLPNSLTDFGYFAYVLRGEAKERLGLYADAKQDLNRALTLEPRAAVAHFEMANLLKKTDRGTDAENELHSLLIYHPNYIPALDGSQSYY